MAGFAADHSATARATVTSVSGKVFGHFAEDLLAPDLQALIAQVVLVGFIQRQADEKLTVCNLPFRAGEFVPFRRPVADKLHGLVGEFVMQHAERIQEPFTVA